MSHESSGSEEVVEVDTTEEEEVQQEEDLGAVCEVCGTGSARKVLVLCKNYGPHHLLGCHTYCMAGDRWRTAGLRLDYFCTACSEYNKSVLKAVQDREEQRALQGGGVALRKGKALEEMPELPPIHAPVRARHAAAVTIHPTAQMKIDRARAAAAEDTSDHAAAHPAAAATAAAGPVAAASGTGRGGGKRLQGLAGRGQPLRGSGPGALEPPKLRGQPQRQQQQQLHKEQPRTAAVNTFVKGLNQDKPGEVKAAQRSTKAAAEREQQLQERERQKKEATAAGIAAGQRAREQRQQLQQQQPPADADAGYTVTVGQLAQISCQIVQAGVKATDDEAELHIMLDLKGHLKVCHTMEALASEQQRHIFRDEMIPELQQPNPGEDRKQLVGGVFDLDLHPSISRYNTSAELSYRPLKFVPVQNARISVQEQLKDRQRFIVVSLGQRLLVFLPTPSGELLLLLPRDAENTDDLVQEVVQSVMRDRNLGATPSQLEARAEQEREQNQQVSESAEGAHAQDPDDKEGVMDEVQQRLAAQPGGPDQQQQQQQQEEQQQQLEPQGSVGRPRVQQGKQQQQQQRRQQQVPLAQQQPNSPQPVQQLPVGMTAAARQQQQEQLQQPQPEVVHAMVAIMETVQAPAGHVLEQPDTQRQENQQQLQTAVQAVQQQAEQQQQQQVHSPAMSPSAAPAAAAAAAAPSRPLTAPHTSAVPVADRVAPTSTVAKSAAGARSRARSSARSGGSGGSAAVLEAVQNSTVARLLLGAAGGAAGGAAAGQLSRRLMMPQLEDLVNVPQLRFYLLGFSLDSPSLLDSIAAAEALGATVHYKLQEQVLRALLDDLGLPAEAAAAGTGQLPAAAADAAAADAAAAGAAADGTAAAAAAGEGDDADVVDLTAPDIGDTFCQIVVLVPEHTSPERLQELLGHRLQLLQLLACRVAFFAQSSCQGPLSWLHRKHRQLQQREQQQQQASSAAAGTKPVHAGNKRAGSIVPQRRRVRQCSGGWQQWVGEGELQTGLDGDEDSSSIAIRLPDWLRQYQLFSNGVAVLMETTGLSSVSKVELQQLLALLAQGQALQEEQRGKLDGDGQWSLLVVRRTLEEQLSASRQAMLRSQLAKGRVLVLDDVLFPDTLADELVVDSALLQNALSLAQQRIGALRLVIVLLPDIDLAVQQQQAGRGVQSAGGMSVGFGGGGCSVSVDTSASEGGCSGGAAAAGAGGDGSYMPGSGTTGDDAGTAAVQQQAEQQRRLRRMVPMVCTLRRQLEEANTQGTVLAGTMRQVLQLLEAMMGKLAQQAGSTAGV